MLFTLSVLIGLYIVQYQNAYPSKMPDLLLKSEKRLDKLSGLAKEITIIHISDGTSKIHLRNLQQLSRFYFQHPESSIIDICTESSPSSKEQTSKQLKRNFPMYESKHALSISQGRLPVTFVVNEALNIQTVHQGELSYTVLLKMTNLDR